MTYPQYVCNKFIISTPTAANVYYVRVKHLVPRKNWINIIEENMQQAADLLNSMTSLQKSPSWLNADIKTNQD
jgi:hypothetical protein